MNLKPDGRLHELSLFSGYCGFTLGLRLAGISLRTVGYVEIDGYRQEIIKARIKDGYLDDAPIWPDIRAFNGTEYRGLVDIITAGFPCEDISVRGRGAGISGTRSGLWKEAIRVVCEVRPHYILLENVPAITGRGLKTVLGDLAEARYDAVWDCISAGEIGAFHKRERWWLLAYPQGESSPYRDLGESDRAIRETLPRRLVSSQPWWTASMEPRVVRMDDGTADRMDRVTALGDGIVPAVVAEFLRRIQ